MKTYKNIGFGPRTSKKGFTLIELLIVMVILAILAGVIVMAVGGVFGSAKSAAYDGVSSQVGTAVGAYAANADHAGSYPIGGAATGVDITDVNGATVNGSSLYLIDFSLLLTSEEGMFRTVPDGTLAIAGAANDNCDIGTDIGGCLNTSHYVWVVDNTTGVTYSYCVGATCLYNGVQTNNRSGYMNVWP